MRIILASSSERRLSLLRLIGLKFEVIPSNVEEDKIKDLENLDAEALVKKLSLLKAKTVAEKVKEGIIIAADTVVVLNDEIIGKPKSEEEASSFLRRLGGVTHKVVSGIALVRKSKDYRELVKSVTTLVKMKELSRKEIKRYLSTGEALDKAGAYAIQGRGAILIEEIKGCYFNVVGLPLYRLSQMLKELGVEVL